MEENYPPPLSAEETVELRRRVRSRNFALLAVLLGLAALFYAISIVKFRVHG